MSYQVYYKNTVVGTCANLPDAEDFATQYEAKMDEELQIKIAQCKNAIKQLEAQHELLREVDMKDFDKDVFDASKERIQKLKNQLIELEDALEYSPCCSILEE